PVRPGLGIALPRLDYAGPCFARELEWLLLHALGRFGAPDGASLYLRLSTKPVRQGPFAEAAAAHGVDALRADVLAGGFWLRPPDEGAEAGVVLAACGALVPEALEAADLLAEEGVDAGLLVASSPDRLYRGWRGAG